MTDPRDELIRLYEETLKVIITENDEGVIFNASVEKLANDALAQGAEIKKRMEEGK